MQKTLLSMCVVAVLGCGPSVGREGNPGAGQSDQAADAGSPDGFVGATATVSGTVWAPGNAPGDVPEGHEIPVAGALVYLAIERPDPIPQQAYCAECAQAPGGVLTDHQGRFTLGSVLPGTYWIVMEKGQFRTEKEITIRGPGPVPLPSWDTALPSEHDPDSGKWIPRMALASGNYDDLQDILGKMKIGEADYTGAFVPGSAAGVFDVYSNGGAIDDVAIGTLGDLVRDLDRMLQYHIIFIPCASGYSNEQALKEQQVLMNIRDYVAAGGKLYVTDWSGEYADNVFPEQLTLGASASVDTPPEAFDADTMTWNPELFGNSNGGPSYNSKHGEVIDDDLFAWLDGQQGPQPGAATGPISALDFEVHGNFVHIEAMTSVTLDIDEEGFPIQDVPKAYVIGDAPDVIGADPDAAKRKPLTVTYEPVGCGRVLYSTYHTTHDQHPGLVPQERILVYLIMEIGLCKQGPVVN